MEFVVILCLVFFLSVPLMLIVALANIGRLQRELERMQESLVLILAAINSRRKAAENVEVPVETPKPEEKPAEEVPMEDVVDEEDVEECIAPVPDQPRPVPRALFENDPPAFVRDPEPMASFEPVAPAPEDADGGYEPTAMDIFWKKVEDWFCVRGDFAPKGVTREFAVATRWLTRVGALLLVGAVAYFLVLAIDKGWIGPVQRVFGMMFWGIIGSVFGTWLKLKSERYAILGEVCAAVGLVAVYLSFGLGHRYFSPPVISSGYVAFAGLFVATAAAGYLSVRLRSLMIAGLALVGGFLVPTICSFTSHDVQLHVYLFILSVGACAVAYFRGWTIYAFSAIVVSAIFSGSKCSPFSFCDGQVAYAFHALELMLFFAMAVRAAVHAGEKVRPVYWAAAALMAVLSLVMMAGIVEARCACAGLRAFHHLAWASAFAVLAHVSRRREWGGTPVLIVYACVCAAISLLKACSWWHAEKEMVMLLFCAFAALLVELGARSGEKALQGAALVATALMSCVGFFFFANAFGASQAGGGSYAAGLASRIESIWPVPALVAFCGWRLGGLKPWRDFIRALAYPAASVMTFAVVTMESHFFGREFLPFLRGGIVTIVWAAVASAFLATGIVRRVRVLRLAGLGLLALSAAKVLLVDTASLATPGRVGVFAAVGILLIVGAFLYLKFKSRFEESDAETPDVSSDEKEVGNA
jgi:uncharacterized membrane protein